MDADITVKERKDEFGRPVIEYHSPKRKDPIEIHKSRDGFQFIEVRMAPSVPKELQGWYTSENLLDKKIRHYLNTVKMTKATERDLKTARREAQKASQEE